MEVDPGTARALIPVVAPGLPSIVTQWRSTPGQGVRVVVFGSSNTELAQHNLGRFSWSCWLETSLRAHVGKHVSRTNVGISGETVKDLLRRVDRDVTPLRPHLVLITIGGNDRWHMPAAQYKECLGQLIEHLNISGTIPAVQTYYSPLTEDEKQPQEMFTPYMDAERELAREHRIPCIDSYRLLHAWHLRDPQGYRNLMLNPGHLNPVGHAVFGTLCVRGFGLPDPEMPADIAADVRAALVAIGD